MSAMASLLLGARILLALVFVVAGVSKLLDRPGSRRALSDFGVAPRLVAGGAILLPLVEIATAAGLVSPASAQWGALAALVLLLGFIGGIINALRKGEAPDCHCFGQIHSAPVGRATLARNGALALLAAFVAVGGPGPSIASWVDARSPAELVAVASTVVAIVLGALALALWTDNRSLRRQRDAAQAEVDALPPGLPVGARAPTFDLPTLEGEALTLASLTAGRRPVVLLFMSPDCPGCQLLLADLGRWQASLADRLTLAVLSFGSAEENRATFDEHGVGTVMLQEGAEMMSDYRVRATPSAVVVAPDGTIASAPAEGAPTIETLVRLTLRRQELAADAGSVAV